MKKLVNVLGLAAVISLAVGPALAVESTALHHWGDHRGGGAPAPEIGAGMLGVLLAAAAAKYFRQRSRG